MLGGLAGLLLICDGLSHVQSRMGMLDAFSALFVVAAFATLLCDRDEVRARMAVVVPRAGSATPVTGRGSGCAGGGWPPGCCSGWAAGSSGPGSTGWPRSRCCCCSGTSPRGGRPASSGRSAARWSAISAPALWALAVVPVLAYLSCWWAWFGSETAIDRHAVGDEIGTGGSVGVPARRAARALVLQRQGAGLPRRAHHRRPAGCTRGSPSRGPGRWACARCSTTTRPASRSPAVAGRAASAR